MIVNQIMHTPPVVIDPGATIQEAAIRMRQKRVGYILAVSGGMPVGILTESDITALVASAKDATKVRVQDLMSRPVVSVAATTQIEDAATVMRVRGIKRLAVVVGGEVRGMVTVRDIAYALPEARQSLLNVVRQRWD